MIIISSRFHPHINKWTGLAVEMGVKGTHEKYNVLYNGACQNEYVKSEKKAKDLANVNSVR